MKKKKLINYWETYYGKNSKFKESTFAKFVISKIKNKGKYKNLIDIGCGNGRDSIFFNKKKLNVLGIDISKSVIKKNSLYSNSKLRFKNFDVEKDTMTKKFDLIYSRFFIHAIDENAENNLLKLIKKIKKKGTLIFLEFRNHKDRIFTIKKLKKHNEIVEFEKGHYRRIIDPIKFTEKFIKNLRCKIIYRKSSKNLSIVKKDNPNLTRIIFKF